MTTDPGKARSDIANALLDLAEQFAPIIDAADGMKAEMERRGWSPTAAETAALAWLTGALGKVWQG
jgi:hypothetical protein